MSELLKQLYGLAGALVLIVVLAPVVIRLVAVVLPLAVVGGLVVIVVRLVWFSTGR